MATITSLATSVPDLHYEYHTITIDSIDQSSANTFTCHLQQPLKNVVQAKLLGARIRTTSATEHCYVSIKELDSIFSDRASSTLDGQASLSILRGSFASIVANASDVVVFKDDYPIFTQYIDPIRRLDRFTVTIRNQDGDTITSATAADKNVLVLRFICMKGNM
jgi:hypothetical protein